MSTGTEYEIPLEAEEISSAIVSVHGIGTDGKFSAPCGKDFVLPQEASQPQLIINESAGVIKAKIGNKTYAINGVSEVVIPSAPTISKTGSDTSASRDITLSCSTSGATIYYTTNGSTPTSSSTKYTNKFSVSASDTASTTSTTIKAIAIKNGESSIVLNHVVKTARHLPKPSITAENSDKYDTSRLVTISGNTSAVFKDAEGNTVTSTKRIYEDTTFKVKQALTGWQDSDFAEVSFAVGAPMTYYGFTVASTIQESQIDDLTPLRKDGLETATGYTINATSSGYLWVCQPNTLDPDAIFNDAKYSSLSGFQSIGKIGSWNVYRISNKIVAGTYTIYLKP